MRFDKASGKAVKVTGPKEKPETVSFKLLNFFLGLL
jgi:hypothetical protein